MKFFLKLALLILILAGIAVSALGIFVDVKYEALRSAGRISHEKLAGPSTAIRAVFDTEYAWPRIEEYLKKNTQIPPWIPPLLLPYEVSLLLGYDSDSESIDVTFLIAERRLGPLIRERVNLAELTKHFPFFDWKPREMVGEERGASVLRGTMPVDSGVGEGAWMLWNQSRTLAPMTVEGGHIVELALDNRGAGTYAILASILPHYDIDTEELNSDDVVDMLSQLTKARLYADLGPDNELEIFLSIEFKEESVEDYEISFKMLVGLMKDAIAEVIAPKYGLALSGDVAWNGNVLEGRFVLDDFDTLMAVLGVPLE